MTTTQRDGVTNRDMIRLSADNILRIAASLEDTYETCGSTRGELEAAGVTDVNDQYWALAHEIFQTILPVAHGFYHHSLDNAGQAMAEVRMDHVSDDRRTWGRCAGNSKVLEAIRTGEYALPEDGHEVYFPTASQYAASLALKALIDEE